MSRVSKIIILVSALSAFCHVAMAYKEPTHEKMSEVAANASVLKNDGNLVRQLGLQLPIDDDRQQFPNSKGEPKNVLLLIKDGSKFEDSGLKSLFHFFDPVYDAGLLFFTSPTWSLEDKGRIHFLQQYSFRDARDAFYEALTAKTEDDRKQYFGKTFETLGHVIHHVQDMAQPQHVRNDTHLDLFSDYSNEELPYIENRSRYEFYTDQVRDRLRYDTYAPVNSKDDVSFLTSARSFWHTESKKPLSGKGIAEFTNSNFVSAGTNFDRKPGQPGYYVSPTFDSSTARLVDIQTLCQEAASNGRPCDSQVLSLSGSILFYGNWVQDNLRPSQSNFNDRASSESIFDQDLMKAGKNPFFTLNRFNFDAAHEFLIPRAVAYSAGLIDYFFRGKLEAEDVEFTDSGIRLRVKNAINAQATPAWANETLCVTNAAGARGVFIIAFEYKDGTGATHYGASSPVSAKTASEGGGDLAPGQTSSGAYDFILPPPADARDTKYRLVFCGKLGHEDHVAAGLNSFLWSYA